MVRKDKSSKSAIQISGHQSVISINILGGGINEEEHWKDTPSEYMRHYKMQEQLFLTIEQIIPIKETEDFVISMANKSREEVGEQEQTKERHIFRKKFWTAYLKEINKVCSLYQNVSPSKEQSLTAGSGKSGLSYFSTVTGQYIRIELYIVGGTKEENKAIFDFLVSKKEEIETNFGHELTWEVFDITCRIKYELKGVSVFNEEDYNRMIEFMVTNVPKFETAFKMSIQELIKVK